METGVLGYHGVIVVLPTEEELKQEQEIVTIRHLTMEEQLVKGHQQKIKLAKFEDVH